MNRILLMTTTVGAVAWSCTQDKGLSVHNVGPNVTIHQPSDNASFDEGATVAFLARIGDDIDGPGDLIHTWSSDIQSDLEDTSTVDASGNVSWVTTTLDVGEHTITLQVVDQDGLEGTNSVGVTIATADRDSDPRIDMVRPSGDDSAGPEEAFEFIADVWDEEDELGDLEVSFETESGGSFCEPIPDSEGEASCDHILVPGEYSLFFRVVDSDGNSDQTPTRRFVVRSDDLDGDGWTEEDGDCDDTDDVVFPGAQEICDDQDNDCDGTADEENAEGCEYYHLDADRDGFGSPDARCLCMESGDYTTLDATDCDDTDAGANPDFSGWSTSATASGEWDWNCDTIAEKQLTGLGECSCFGTSSVGWQDSEAACGELGVYISGCDDFGCDPVTATIRQACR